MKIAILHEMLIKLWWAEKVLEKLVKIFPEADIFTLIYDENKVWKLFPKNKINFQVFSLRTQKIYNFFQKQRFCLPFMALSVESLDFSQYDVVICSSSWFAHWAITKPETKCIVYYHSPMRYLWDWTNEYKKDIWFSSWIKWFLLNKLFLSLRQWDYIASKRSDFSFANSLNTWLRIKKYFKKDYEILYPPVETKRFSKKLEQEESQKLCKFFDKISFYNKDYYIIISALTEFKKIEIAINWFNKLPNNNLFIIWAWDYEEKLKNMVKWKNINFVWPKYGDELVSFVQKSSWLIFPWEEDFWIVPIEVMASWKPIFAYRWWWLLETVKQWITWEFFDDKNWDDFVLKFQKFDENNKAWFYKADNCIKQAEKFWEENFEKRIKEVVLINHKIKKIKIN